MRKILRAALVAFASLVLIAGVTTPATAAARTKCSVDFGFMRKADLCVKVVTKGRNVRYVSIYAANGDNLYEKSPAITVRSFGIYNGNKRAAKRQPLHEVANKTIAKRADGRVYFRLTTTGMRITRDVGSIYFKFRGHLNNWSDVERTLSFNFNVPD